MIYFINAHLYYYLVFESADMNHKQMNQRFNGPSINGILKDMNHKKQMNQRSNGPSINHTLEGFTRSVKLKWRIFFPDR